MSEGVDVDEATGGAAAGGSGTGQPAAPARPPRRGLLRRRLVLFGVPLAVLLSLLAAYLLAGGDDVEVDPPAPDATGERLCRDLHGALPATVAGLRQRATEPSSPYTAAWGDPAVVLRCGVARPPVMDDPRANGGEVNGVDWVLEKREDGRYRCTTSYRKAYVEVVIPAAYGDVKALVDLAGAVEKAVPRSL
ncbi:DUF3515 domain-containing protein [Streptomyces sp. NPDC047097]|uniref:DUF3515 domain-containing protein n=1 Tax=Streptomyces sp. NPDC047097 TaxID=3155260 RepID=UPI003409C9A0